MGLKRKKRLLGILIFSLVIGMMGSAGGEAEAKKKIILNKKKAVIYVGGQLRLKVKGTKKKVKWSSKEKKIATVSKKGVVKGKRAGKTKITAKVKGKKLVCRLTVKAKKKRVITTAEATPQGEKKPAPQVTQTPGGTDKPSASPAIEPVVTPTAVPTPTPVDTSKPEPVFSKESGSYDKSFKLSLHAPKGSKIYYTTDGSEPDVSSVGGSVKDTVPAKLPTNEYKQTITVKNRDNDENRLCSKVNIPYMYDPTEYYNNGPFYPEVSAVPKATIIRAMAVDEKGNTSKTVTKTYFVDKNLAEVYKNASVISVVTDPDNLLSEEKGIYRYGNWENSGTEWERPAAVTYFEEDGTIPFETTMGMRIHGNYTRRWGQKSLRFYFREELGLKNLKGYQLIPGAVNADGKPTKKYKRFILRNGGNEYAYSKMQDVFIQSLVSDRAFTTQSSRPCVLFLNGEYWGLYNLMERYSDNYLEEEFGVDKDNVVVIKNDELDEGKEEDFALYEQLQAMADLDMSLTDNYEKFKKMVDIQSYLDYYATEIYIGNKDWPDNNVQLWRTREDDGSDYGDTKWRYMLYDTEYSMNLWGQDNNGNTNRLQEARNKDALFDALCKNDSFKQSLADTLMDLADKNFKSADAAKKLDAMAAVYRPLMEQYKKRFGNGDVDSRVRDMKSFMANRKSQIKKHIQESLSITVK